MTVRIKHKVNIRIWETSAEKDVLFAPDDALSEVQIDGYDKQASGKLEIDVSSNEDLTFGDVDAVKGIYLKVNIEAKVKINGMVTPLQLRKGNTGTDEFAKLFLEADITSVNIENPDATNKLTGTYCVWGDVTP